jgi:hypothetical protein
MIARPRLARRHVLSSFLAALLSAALSTGLLGAVGGLFERDGAPFERLVAAERDCAGYAYVSEREACIRIEAARQVPRRLATAGHASVPHGSRTSNASAGFPSANSFHMWR